MAVSLRALGISRHSGAETEMRLVEVYTFRHGKVIRRRVYAERADALKAVGVEE